MLRPVLGNGSSYLWNHEQLILSHPNFFISWHWNLLKGTYSTMTGHMNQPPVSHAVWLLKLKFTHLFYFYSFCFFSFGHNFSVALEPNLDLSVYTKLVSYSQISACLCLPNAGRNGVHHHCLATFKHLKKQDISKNDSFPFESLGLILSKIYPVTENEDFFSDSALKVLAWQLTINYLFA